MELWVVGKTAVIPLGMLSSFSMGLFGLWKSFLFWPPFDLSPSFANETSWLQKAPCPGKAKVKMQLTQSSLKKQAGSQLLVLWMAHLSRLMCFISDQFSLKSYIFLKGWSVPAGHLNWVQNERKLHATASVSNYALKKTKIQPYEPKNTS